MVLRVVLVVGLRLGCLNHALLTAQAIDDARLPLAGGCANSIDPNSWQPHDENAQQRLPRTSGLPCWVACPAREPTRARSRPTST